MKMEYIFLFNSHYGGLMANALNNPKYRAFKTEGLLKEYLNDEYNYSTIYRIFF